MTTDEPYQGRYQDQVHLLPVRVYYEDTDFTGIVYHANYLRFFERGRTEFLRAAGVHHSELLEGEAPLAFAVNRIEIDYVKPARIDEALTVKTAFETMRGPRIFIAQRLYRGGENLVNAKVEVCCISLTGQARKPPAMLLERLKPFLGGSTSSF